MSQFDIAVWTSQELFNNEGYDAQNMAKEFIEGAFNRSNNHSVDVTLADAKVDAPKEYANSSFNGPLPCNDSFYDDFNHLLHWFREWLDCNNPPEYATDCNLLITHGETGGLGGGNDAYAHVGKNLAKFYSYQTYGFSSKHDSVDTLLEEVGHSLIQNMENQDDNTVSHDSGTLFSHPGGHTITPLGITGDTAYNNCNEYVDKSQWSGDGWEARYSECTESNFVKK